MVVACLPRVAARVVLCRTPPCHSEGELLPVTFRPVAGVFVPPSSSLRGVPAVTKVPPSLLAMTAVLTGLSYLLAVLTVAATTLTALLSCPSELLSMTL